jgi:hypothetical protein
MEQSISDDDRVESNMVDNVQETAIDIDISAAEPSSAGAHVSAAGRCMNKRKTTSLPWDHFTRIDGRPACMECMSQKRPNPTSYSASTGSSVLIRHLKTSCAIAKDTCIVGDFHQQNFSSTGCLDRHDLMGDERRAEALKALVRWVVDDKQSISVVERPSFKIFAGALCRQHTLPSRRTLERALLEEFENDSAQFRSLLDGVRGRFGLTVDCWSS